METLISVFTMVIELGHAIAKFFSDLAKPLSNIETVALIIMLAVVVAGVGAFGRRRKPGHLPWD